MNRTCPVIILAAGFSSRMNFPKFALKFDQKRTFLEKISEEYITFGCKEIICVLNAESYEFKNEMNLNLSSKVRFTINKFPEKERFYSLQIGLNDLTDKDFVFIQNIDNPFIDQEILNLIYHERNNADFIVPSYKGKGGHPILVNKKIARSVINETNHDQNLKEFLKQFEKLKVESKELITKDINNQETYMKYFK